jgi:cytoskeletal protein RodZ
MHWQLLRPNKLYKENMIEPITNTPNDTQIPVVPPPTTSPSPVITPAPVHSPLLPLFIGLSVVALGMAGFFGYKYFQLNQQTAKAPSSPVSSAEPIKSPEKVDPTSNWKTYTDPKNLFSFSYPSDGRYDQKKSSIALSDGNVQVYSPAPMGYGYCYKYSPEKTVTLNGNKFKLITGTGVSEKTEMCDNPNPDKGSIVATTSTSNNDVLIEYSYDIKNADKASKLVNQILSTFKFSSSAESASSTANWITYTNNEKGYEVKYPKETFIQYICPNEELLLGVRPKNNSQETVTMEDCARDVQYPIAITTLNRPLTAPSSDEYVKVSQSKEIINKITWTTYTILQVKEDPRGISRPSGHQEMYYIYQRGNQYYNFYFDTKEVIDIAPQILSTFKFTE